MNEAVSSASRAPFRPWIGKLKVGLGFLILGPLAAYLGQDWILSVAIFGWLITMIGFVFLGQALVRMNGQWIEQRAIKSLRLPPGWRVTPNVLVKGIGDIDIDIVIESPSSERFAVEIKSHKGVKWKKGWFGIGDGELVRLNGRKLERDPVGQVIRAAEAIDATPVLWFPAAPWSVSVSGNAQFTMKSGVIVVQGSERLLQKALGAKFAWSLF